MRSMAATAIVYRKTFFGPFMQVVDADRFTCFMYEHRDAGPVLSFLLPAWSSANCTPLKY